jgi:hypothetical protein
LPIRELILGPKRFADLQEASWHHRPFSPSVCGRDPSTSGGMTPDAMVLAMRTMAPTAPGDVPALSLRLYDGRRLDPPVCDYQVAAIDGILDV